MSFRAAFALLALTSCAPARAAFEERPSSARAAALGEAMTAAGGGADAWPYNPASLRFLSRAEAVAGRAQVLGEKDLPASAAVLGLPTAGWGSFGAAYTQFGNALYREREASLGQAVLLSPEMAVGAAATGSFMEMDRYGGASAWSVDAGVLGRPHPRAAVGFSLKRLNRPRLGRARLPPSMRGGASFILGRNARLSLDAVKPQDRPFSTRAGLDVALAPAFFLRLGGESRPSRYTLGFGLASSVARLDYAFLSHPFLGDQHQVSMTFSWGVRRPEPKDPKP